MLFKRLATGILSSNCYIIGDNGEGAIIDPGAPADEITEAVENLGLKIKYIILTHAHIDHMMSVDKIRHTLGAKVLVHEKDAPSMSNEWYNASYLFGANEKFQDADVCLKDGDILDVGGLQLRIIHTPGHTPGGISIKVGNIVFTGDTLFRMSVGRTDLGNGDAEALMDSLQNRLMKLDDDVIAYPGHGMPTKIGYERQNNPCF